jgi:hypothetical protein
MTDMFLERRFDPPTSVGQLLSDARGASGCLNLHRVQWLTSFFAADGRDLVCWFRAADAESCRIALRQAGADITDFWPGTVHEAATPVELEPNVLVTRHFADPAVFADIQAIEAAGAWCLEAHGVTFVRTLFATDRRRMLCLYHAPDAESVRLAQRQANMPMETVRPIEIVRPPVDHA